MCMIDHLSSRDKAKLFSFGERHSHFLNFNMDSHRFIPFFTPDKHIKNSIPGVIALNK